MPTNAKLLAEIDRLNQAMAERIPAPSSLSKFTGKRGEDVREWLFQIENACRIKGIQIDDASPTFSYLPGAKNGIADALSRKPDLQPETKFFHDLSVTSFADTSIGLANSEVTGDSE
ncbi:uncharacterized protein IUM83_12358 [Phytophthora cinnamomi]|uniref:uncharacterized protein n=1 Tax=Phytophthora cinnamomi TaxID=4785 RepID=UPI0035597878|nr:hypothetical protein IUM83_12358 [Phytophthora cinnamomi]